MPTIRYQIRSEYGLAEPELYQSADKDDPEAILEGVAMAGLVGVLRQLGDLAEFAAQIFHNLHEEVMTTAARGHGMMLRVQQLESEIPSIEKAFFSQSNHSNLAYNEGIDWHCNIQLDQNLLTHGDMPRFILDSYEESRGPPRLFTLDKFDVAGAGACLKRYTDPSYFKTELASSGILEMDVQREKKGRKIKKKGSRWRNGQTLESLMSPKADTELLPANSNKVHDKTAIRVVKLKSRHRNGIDTSKSKRLMELLLEMHMDVQKAVVNDSGRHSQIKIESGNFGDSAEVHDILVDTPDKYVAWENGSTCESPTKKEASNLPANDLENPIIEDKLLKDPGVESFSEVDESKKIPQQVSKNKLSADLDDTSYANIDLYALGDSQKTASVEKFNQVVETEVSIDGYRSDEFGSEQENFVDAVNTIDSEIETDVECVSKPDTVALSTEAYSVGIDSDGLDDMQDRFSAFDQPQTHILKDDSVEISSTPSEPNKLGGISSLSGMDASDSTVEVELTKEEVTSNLDSNSDKVVVENHDSKSELPGITAEAAEPVCSNGSKTCNGTPEDLTFGSKTEDETQNSSVTDSPSHTVSNLLGLDTSHAIADVQVTDEELAADSDIDSVKSIDGSHDQVQEILGPSSEIAKTTCPITDNACQSTIDGPVLESEVANSSQPFSVTDSASLGISTYPRENLEEPLFFTDQNIESSSCSEGESGQIENDKTESAEHLYEQHPQGSVQSDGSDDEICVQIQQQDLVSDIPSNDANGTVEMADHLDCSSIDIKDIDFQQSPCLEGHLLKQIAEAAPGGLHHEDLVEDISSDETESVDVAAYVDAPSTVTKDIKHSESSSSEDYMLEMSPQEVDNGTDFTDNFYEMKDDDSRNDDGFGYWEYAPPPFTVQDSQSEIQTENDIDAYSHGVMITGLPRNELDNNFELAHLDDLEVLDKHALLEHSPDSKFNFNANSEDLGGPALQKELEDLTEPERDREHHKENSTELVMPLHSEIDAENKTLSNDTNLFLIANTSEDLMDYSMPIVDDKKLWVIEDSPDKNDMTVESELHRDEFSSDNGTAGATSEIPLQLEDDNISVAENPYQPKTSETGKAEEALLATYNLSSLAASDSGLPMKDLFETGDSSRLHNQNDKTLLYRSDQIDVHPYADDTSENSLGRKEFSPKSSDQCSEAEEEQENTVPYNFSDSSLLPIKEPNNASLQEDAPAFIDSSFTSVPIHKEVSNMQGSSESSTLSSNQDIKHGEADNVTTANSIGELSGAKPVADHNNLGSNELDGIGLQIPDSDIAGQLELDTPVSSLSNFVSFPASLDIFGIGSEDPAACSFPPYVEVPPPLPPLPPLQWRTGKFPLRSLISDGNLFHHETNPFGTSNMEEKPAKGLLVEGSKGTQLEHQFAEPLPLRLSELLLPTADAGQIEEDIIVLHAKSASHSNSSLVSSSSAHDESLHVPDTSERLELQSPNLLTSFSVSDDIITEHSPLVEIVQPLADNILQCDQILSTSNKESSQEHENDEVNLDAEKAPCPNDFLVGSVADNTHHLHVSELSQGETLDLGKPLDFPPASLSEVPQFWYPHLLDQSEFSQFSILRKEDDERLTGKPLKIRNRPKDPLIEAVAAHDRSSLRKVSNLIQESDKPEADQRNTLLEQIRSKAFNLKPAAAARQNIKGPSTNLKVAAIIEKANAIRQAFVGSDDDDDEDSWNSA